jgi:hypothetical protein
MRDKRFIVIHRGGALRKEHHRLLMRWAYDCAVHILPLLGENIDERLNDALKVAMAWERGEASVGDARKASVKAHAAARSYTNNVSVAIARAIGHAVATAHMADHSLGAVQYALKAIKVLGESVELEQKWQDEQLPSDIKELIISARITKFK